MGQELRLGLLLQSRSTGIMIFMVSTGEKPNIRDDNQQISGMGTGK